MYRRHSKACGQIASLAFLLYDIMITFDDEVDIIWSKPNNSWIKWQFLFTRYFALATQLTNRSLESVINSTSTRLTGSLKGWYICQVVVGSMLMTAVEMVLMARVYAIYNKNSLVAAGFFCLLMGELISLIVGVTITIPGKNFHLSTFVDSSPNSYAYFGAAAGISQVTILILTLMKYRSAVRGGWARLPIMQLMVRDGTIAFVVLFSITALTALSSIKDRTYPPLGNSWFLSVVACAGCRLIINMQRLPSSSNETATGSSSRATIELTTVCPDSLETTSVAGDRHV
ncbi:hypothetical protein BDQ17DRAFT_935961 [Cyathus striatus]|nr:hypothetical protein BDQ17DRAFT_935961 [Cyathus striatus]